jgi:hypothetical protein
MKFLLPRWLQYMKFWNDWMCPVTNRLEAEPYVDVIEQEKKQENTNQVSLMLARDGLIAAAIFIVVLISRIPFQSQILYHWDSVNFAAAISQFDLANESPHPPGYILYVWLTRAVNMLFNDPQTTMVSISIVSSALAAAALFILGKLMFNRAIGITAALFLATSPIFWFYGEIALPHTLDTVFVIASAGLLYLTMQGDYRFLYPAILTAAVAGGLRPQTLVFLLPLLLFAIRKAGFRRIVTAGILGGVACVLWFVPLITASGGFSTYMEVMNNFSQRFQESTSIFMGAGMAGVQRNATKVVLYTAYGLSLAALPMIGYGFSLFAKRQKIAFEKALFIFFWIAPVLFFYIAIHMGQQGLIFVYLPALLLIAAVSVHRIFNDRTLLRSISIGIIVLFNIGLFTLMPEYPMGPGTQRMLTHDTLRNSDQYFLSRIEAIEYNFQPGTTGIIALDWRHAEYYLTEYTVIPLNSEKWGKFKSLDDQGYLSTTDFESSQSGSETVYIVLFDRGLNQRDISAEGILKMIELANGETLSYYELNTTNRLFLEEDEIELIQ